MSRNSSFFYQKGFTLLEVLISLVVLAIGLLGLAILQTTALRQNLDATFRSIAIVQANNIMDRMRANQSGVSNGFYNNLTGLPTSSPICVNCTPTQVATRDHFDWNTENGALLPAGQGSVVGDSSVFTITIMWDNERTGATGTNCSGNSLVDLTCLIVNVQI